MIPRFAHQEEVLEKTWRAPGYALFWQQRTGKTRTALETAGRLWAAAEIEGVLVLAPNGVHRQWAEEQAPLWLPEAQAFAYDTSKVGGKAYGARLATVFDQEFPLLAMSYDGFVTTRGRAYARAFLKKFRCLFVCDESTEIKTPRAKRTRVVVNDAKLAPYRRILTGTPVSNSPFDVYSQIKFLDETFWARHGFHTPAQFRSYFAYIEERVAPAGHRYPFVLRDALGNPRYRHLDELKALLAPISHRVLRDEVHDMPPKLYAKAYFDLTPFQRRTYDQLRDSYVTWLAAGAEVTAPLAVVRLTRLAQITSNHLPADDDPGQLRPVDAENPRLQKLQELVCELAHPTIVWVRWRRDADSVCHMLGALGRTYVRYDGAVREEDRAAAKAQFQSGAAQFVVANAAVGAMGLDFSAARTVIYYGNSFSLLDREQSEDRAQSLGKTHPVEYVDLVAADTVDEHIIDALRAKVDVASQVTGDRLRAWL